MPPRPLILDPEPRRRLAQIAAALAGPQPATVVAVTGTNGKTSTVEFLRQIWAAGGTKAASLGTLGLIAPGFDPGPGLTTPDPVTLAETLAGLARAGVAHAAMEASSHGLDQFRLDGVRLAAGGFTNLTRDHLDYHGTDGRLPRRQAAAVRGAAAGRRAGGGARRHGRRRPWRRCATSPRRRRLDLRTVGEARRPRSACSRATPRPDGQMLTVEVGGARREVALPLPGRFQADNALLAAALADGAGRARRARPAGAACPACAAGMELAARLANGAAVYVDYAHTPDALERLLTRAAPAHRGPAARGVRRRRRPRSRQAPADGRGGRALRRRGDRHRRQSRAARTRPRSAPRVLAGLPRAARARSATARAAIAAALAALGPGDVLAVAGKGHEQGQTIGGTVIPFDDVAVVRRLVGRRA